MQLHGKLEKFEFSDILQMLSRSGKSGKLALTQRAGQGVIVLRDGRIIYAASSSVRETLGNILLCKGLITDDGLQRGLDRQRRAGEERRLGAILVEEGLVSQRELKLVVREQVQKIVLEMLAWHSGYFRFDELRLADRGEVEIDALEFLYSDGLPADEMLLGLSLKLDDARRSRSPGEAPIEAVGLPALAGGGSSPALPGNGKPVNGATGLSAIMTESHAPEFTGEITLEILSFAQRVVRRGVLFRSSPLGFAGMGQFGIEPPAGQGADFVRQVVLPLEQPSILTEAVVRKSLFRGPLEETAVNRSLVRSLGGGWPAEVVAVPLIAGGRVLLIFYGDNLPGVESLGALEELELVLLEAGLAMERSVLARRAKHLEQRQRV